MGVKGQTRGSKDCFNLFQRAAREREREAAVAGSQEGVGCVFSEKAELGFHSWLTIAALGPGLCQCRRLGVRQSRLLFLWVSPRRVKIKPKDPGEAGGLCV